MPRPAGPATRPRPPRGRVHARARPPRRRVPGRTGDASPSATPRGPSGGSVRLLRQPALGHVVAGQHLQQEVRRRGRELRRLVLPTVQQYLDEHVVVHPDHLQQVEPRLERGPAELVARMQRRLLSTGEVAQERHPVVTQQVLARPHLRRTVAGAASAKSNAAMPSSRSSAVTTEPVFMPSCTIAKATSGWMPTITVAAPRSRAISPMSRRVREAYESRTSRAATSTTTPRARSWPIRCTRSSLNRISCESSRAVWIDAIR